MPSSAIQNQIPFSVLFPHLSFFSLPPHVFGSTCFVHNFTPGKDKLAPRALKCVFLGYSRKQKGYRCYSPDLQRYLMSADVTFFETQSYFTGPAPPPTAPVAAPPPTAPVAAPPPIASVPPPIAPPLLTYHRRPRPTSS
uniref:Leucine-rich repeat extensin-like protein 2 n=1 Tax=Nicotiana sylvestris TaxID=4096 RepID=A0A1U7YBA0_NICSY|nr:PREDICTED: leucine-rich repeat extensin-like protein 2 [Nicotiana sylvestris]